MEACSREQSNSNPSQSWHLSTERDQSRQIPASVIVAHTRPCKPSASGPTATQRDSFAIAEDEFKSLEKQLERLFKVEMVALKKEMEAAGVPWSPGR